MSTAAALQPERLALDEGQDRLLQRWLFALLALGVLWRVVRYLLRFPVWGDEAFICLNMVDETYLGLTGQLRCSQVAPLLFLWGELTAFLHLGNSELALRFVPFLAGMGGLLLTWRLAYLILPPLGRTLAVAFLAVAIWPVSMSTLIKPYSMDLLMSAALLVLTVQWLQRPDRTIWLLLLGLVAPLAIFGSYPSVFVAGGVSLALLLPVWRQSGWKARVYFVIYNGMLFGSFLGNYFLVGLNQLDRSTGSVNQFLQDYWKHGFPPHGILATTKWFLLLNTGRLFAYPLGGSDGLSALTSLLFLVGLWWLWRQRQSPLIVLFLTPFVLGVVAAYLRRYPYGGCCRLSQHVAPIICCLAGAGAGAVIERVRSAELRRRCILGACGLFALVGMGGALTDVIWPYRGLSDVWMRKIVHMIAAHCNADDQIVVLKPENGVDVVYRWELERYRLNGGYVGWQGQLDRDRLQSKTGQVWVLNVDNDITNLDKVRAQLQQSNRTWLLVNQIPYTVVPPKKKDPVLHCELYRWISPTDEGITPAALAISCWP